MSVEFLRWSYAYSSKLKNGIGRGSEGRKEEKRKNDMFCNGQFYLMKNNFVISYNVHAIALFAFYYNFSFYCLSLLNPKVCIGRDHVFLAGY